MAIITIFAAASFVASTIVVSACVLSSRVSQRQQLGECYDEYEESMPMSPTPFSAN